MWSYRLLPALAYFTLAASVAAFVMLWFVE
jgi:hypothetical protein